MELLKLQCSSCGGSLEIKPGIDRLKCPYCGTNYLLKRDDNNTKSTMTNASGDNPVDVVLVPMQENTIIFEPKDLVTIPSAMGANGIRLDSDKEINPKLFEKIVEIIKLFACLVYLTKKDFQLELGQIPLDETLVYYKGKKKIGYDYVFSDEDLLDLVEPKKTYYHMGWDTLNKPQYNKDALYDSKIKMKLNEEKKKIINDFITKYKIEYEDKVKCSSTICEHYKKDVFIKTINCERFWTCKYTSRRLFLKMNYEMATKILSEDDITKLNKIGKQDCIKDMASIIYQELAHESEEQLKERKHNYIKLHFTKDHISIENPNNFKTMVSSGGAKSWKSQQFISIDYKNYGMSNVENKEINALLLAQTINYVFSLIDENKDVKWNISEVNFFDLVIELKLFPTVKAEGVYNSWI